MEKTVSKLHGELSRLLVFPQEVVPSGNDIISVLIASVISRSTVILHGPPGCAKSTAVKLIAKAFGITGQWRINGTVGTKEEDLVGGLDLVAMANGERKVVFSPFIETPMALIDEVDKINPHAMAPLLPLLAENEARVGTECKVIGKRFTAMTMNPPAAGQGNFDLPDALKDRADLEIMFPPVTFIESQRITETLQKVGGDLVKAMPTLAAPSDLVTVQEQVEAIPVSAEARLTLGVYLDRTRRCVKDAKEELSTFPGCCADCEHADGSMLCSKITPLSERVAASVIRVAKGLAYLHGHKEVSVDLVDKVMPFAISHRANFPNQVITNRRAFTHQFFHQLKGGVSTVLRLLFNPQDIDSEQMDRLKDSTDPLLKSAVKFVASELGQIGEKLKHRLPLLTTAELKSAKKKGGITMKDRQVVDQMISARTTVSIQVSSEDLLMEPAFRELFTSPEGVPFQPNASWDELASEGLIAQASLGLGTLGINMEFDGSEKLLHLMFNDGDSADDFRARFVTVDQIEGYTFALVDPYRIVPGLLDRMKSQGFFPEEEQEVAA